MERYIDRDSRVGFFWFYSVIFNSLKALEILYRRVEFEGLVSGQQDHVQIYQSVIVKMDSP